MTKIRMAVSAALMAAAGLVGTQSALAATAPNVAPSDLFAAVWNSTTNTSIVIDLGTTWSQINSTSSFQSSAGYTQSWALDLSQVAGANNFSVFAGNNSSSTTPAQFFMGMNGTTAPTITTPGLTGNIFGSVNPYITNFMPGTTTSVVGSGTATGTAYYAQCTANPGCNGGSYGLFALNNLGAATPGTGSLNFYQYTAGPARGNATGSFVGNSAGAGVFTLSGSTLTYTLAAVGGSTVPLPAAGWLLISGLFGFGAVSRRRDKAVA